MKATLQRKNAHAETPYHALERRFESGIMRDSDLGRREGDVLPFMSVAVNGKGGRGCAGRVLFGRRRAKSVHRFLKITQSSL
jgi:hypothetical protein